MLRLYGERQPDNELAPLIDALTVGFDAAVEGPPSGPPMIASRRGLSLSCSSGLGATIHMSAYSSAKSCASSGVSVGELVLPVRIVRSPEDEC